MAGETQVVFSYPGTPVPGEGRAEAPGAAQREAECEPRAVAVVRTVTCCCLRPGGHVERSPWGDDQF